MTRSFLLALCFATTPITACDDGPGGGEPDARDAVEIVETVADDGGEVDPCRLPGGLDYSTELATTAALRTFCANQCYAECHMLVDCGRYPAGDDGWAQCVSECTAAGARDCAAVTFERLCPAATYGTGAIITEAESEACAEDSRWSACWCTAGTSCWSPFPAGPISCTTECLCDPR